MEDRQNHPAGARLGDELRRRPPKQQRDQTDMKRFSENGARPVFALGEPPAQPLGRLGALVFQPHNSESLYWAGLSAQTRIAGCAWAKSPATSAGKTFPSEKRSSGWLVHPHPRRRKICAWRSENSVGFVKRNWISFSLWTGLADYPRETPGSGPSLCRERLHPQSTGGLSAQVALLQSPILSAAGAL